MVWERGSATWLGRWMVDRKSRDSWRVAGVRDSFLTISLPVPLPFEVVFSCFTDAREVALTAVALVWENFAFFDVGTSSHAELGEGEWSRFDGRGP